MTGARQIRLPPLKVSLVNDYLAHKQHLLPASRLADVVQVARDVVALHATNPAGPYLALWARVPGFQREMLDDAMYEQRTLAKVLCMRMTLHVVPSDEAPFFVQIGQALAERRTPPRFRGGGLLVHAGLCREENAAALLEALRGRVLNVLAEKGPATLQEISPAVPELTAKIQHSEGKAYEGEFSIGTRLMGEWCARGVLVRTRPRGTWRSSLHEYAAREASDWLPDVDLASVTPEEARAWLVRRYLAALGPATLDDVQWWTGLTKTETKNALKPLEPELAEVSIAGLGCVPHAGRRRAAASRFHLAG